MWNDDDRKKQRTYLIYVGRKLNKEFVANLSQATEEFEKVCENNECTVTLYADKRSIENICCRQTVA